MSIISFLATLAIKVPETLRRTPQAVPSHA
jgi:hypothetical protein